MSLVPAHTVPLPSGRDRSAHSEPFPVRMVAAANTVAVLAAHGLPVVFDPADCKAAGEVLMEYAKDPEAANKAMTEKRMGSMTPTALRAVDQQLRTFSHKIVESAEQVRTYVTNRLVEESTNPDPRIRIKALELLGKVGDVGLFVERSEVTVTHQSSEQLRNTLRDKLRKLSVVEDAEVIDAVPEDTPKALLTPEALSTAWD